MTNFKIDECSAALAAAEAALADATKAAAKAAASYEDAKASLDDPENSRRASKKAARKAEMFRLYAVAQTRRREQVRASWAVESAQADLWWSSAQAEYQLPDGAVKWCRSWHRNGGFAITCLGESYSPEMGDWVGKKSRFDEHTAEYVYECQFEHGEVIFTSRGVRRANPEAVKLFGG